MSKILVFISSVQSEFLYLQDKLHMMFSGKLRAKPKKELN